MHATVQVSLVSLPRIELSNNTRIPIALTPQTTVTRPVTTATTPVTTGAKSFDVNSHTSR